MFMLLLFVKAKSKFPKTKCIAPFNFAFLSHGFKIMLALSIRNRNNQAIKQFKVD